MDYEEEDGVSAGLTLGCPITIALGLVLIGLVILLGAVLLAFATAV